MTKIPNQQIIDETFRAIFEESPFNFNQVLEKFAFDVKLPQEVYDSTTGEKTWATSINPTKFITQKTATKKLMIGCKIKLRHPALLNYYHFGNELTTQPPNESMTAKMSSKAIPSTHPTMSGAPAIATNAKTSFFAIVASAATI